MRKDNAGASGPRAVPAHRDWTIPLLAIATLLLPGLLDWVGL